MLSHTYRAIALGGALLAGGAAHATDLRYATGFTPGSTGAENAVRTAEYLNEISGGAMTMEPYVQSLLSFGEMSAGVRDGVADAGFVLVPYSPAEFRNTGMIADLTMLFTLMGTGDRGGLAWTGALTEYVMLACPACQAEMKAQNQVYTSTSGTEYALICDATIDGKADLQGLKIRAPGGNWSRWAEAFGAVPVQLNMAETFEAMSQGIIDCTISGLTEITDMGLTEVAKTVLIDVPGGGFGGSAMFNVNLDVWSSMSEDERKHFVRAANFGGADLSWGYRENNLKGRAAAEAAGITVKDADSGLSDETVAWVKQDIDGIATLYAEKYGLENTAGSIETFLGIFEKWTGLVQDVDSAMALSDLIWDEVGSKIDYSTYGM